MRGVNRFKTKQQHPRCMQVGRRSRKSLFKKPKSLSSSFLKHFKNFISIKSKFLIKHEAEEFEL